MKFATIIFASAISLMPHVANAEPIELSQAQLRQLVVEGQVLDAEAVVTGASRNFGGVVMDIRGFLAEGQMTYRLLMQRNDGTVIEVLVNGVDGHQVSPDTPMGQIVSAVAREINSLGRSNRGASNANRGSGRENSNRGNGRGNSNRGNSDRGNSDRGNNGKGRN